MSLEKQSLSLGLFDAPPLVLKVYCWGFPTFWNLFTYFFLQNHVFKSPAYSLLVIDFFFVTSIMLFASSRWFRLRLVPILATWAILFFPIYLCTAGILSRVYVYVFENLSDPWHASPFNER